MLYANAVVLKLWVATPQLDMTWFLLGGKIDKDNVLNPIKTEQRTYS